jgi:hypothetical protein
MQAYFDHMSEDRRRLTRDAVFRAPSGVIYRRVELVEGRLPAFVDLPVTGRAGTRDRYFLAVNDPIRPVYRLQAQLPPEAST